MKKAQSSLEFMILVGAVLFFMVAFIFFIYTNIAEKEELKINALLYDLAYTIQDEVNLASMAQNGYSREFTLPRKVADKNYSASLRDKDVFIRTTDNKYSLSIPIGNVSGQLIEGTNKISKYDGTIYLNQ